MPTSVAFFDNISHEWMVKFVEHRVADRKDTRLIRNGSGRECRRRPIVGDQTGYAAGAVISPLLANVYLHYVLDL